MLPVTQGNWCGVTSLVVPTVLPCWCCLDSLPNISSIDASDSITMSHCSICIDLLLYLGSSCCLRLSLQCCSSNCVLVRLSSRGGYAVGLPELLDKWIPLSPGVEITWEWMLVLGLTSLWSGVIWTGSWELARRSAWYVNPCRTSRKSPSEWVLAHSCWDWG